MSATHNHWKIAAYILFAAIALAYPVGKILSFEYPSVPPQSYLFETEIRDPYDPMRGRYVALSFALNQIELPHLKKSLFSTIRHNMRCYAVLGKDDAGHAKIIDLVTDPEKIPNGKNFLKVRYLYYFQEKKSNNGKHNIRLPFDRFYLNEMLAPAAERLFIDATRRRNAYAKVNIYADGGFFIEDLIIDNQPILETLRKSSAENRPQ